MKKPLYQKILERVEWWIIGAILLGGLLDAISNAITLVTFQLALSTTICVIVVYVILILFFKYRKIKWKGNGQDFITISDLGKKLRWKIFGGISLLWIGAIYNTSKTSNTILVETPSKIVKPIFDSLDNHFKILVLPFHKECAFEGRDYDVGVVICRRLENLNVKDTLNLSTHFFTDSIDLRNINSRVADSLMKKNNADQIIYGFYSLKECESGGSDKVCFNYRTLQMRHSEKFRQGYNMTNFSGLDAIRNGEGQLEIDLIIYRVATISAYIKQEFVRALRLINRNMSFENDTTLRLLKGQCYIALKDYRNAKKSYEKILSNNPNQFLGLNGISRVYYLLNEYEKSKKYCLKALQIDSANYLTWSSLGSIYMRMKNYPEAIRSFQKSSSIFPFLFNNYYQLGAIYSELQNYQQSKFFFEKSIELNPNDDDAWAQLGRSNCGLLNYQEAEKAFEKAILINENNGLALLGLGEIIYDGHVTKDIFKAKKYLERVLKLDSTNFHAWTYLGNIYLINLKDSTMSKNCFEKGLEFNQTNGQAFANLGFYYINTKNFLNAKKYLELAIKTNRRYPNPDFQNTAQYNLAVTYSLLTKNKTMTIYYLKMAIQQDLKYKLMAKNDPSFNWLFSDKEFISITQ